MKLLSLIAALAISSALFAAPAVVYLTPPELTGETILQETACTRPMREGRFNISIEMKNGKRLVHCYGHGGSGWTTLFGSVGKAIELFEAACPAAVKQKSIRVIGSGCMGMTAAIELARKGYRVKGIYTRELYDLCSWRAAGYFALVSGKTSPEEQKNLDEIGVATFKTYQQIHEGKHPYLKKSSVRYLPVYCSEETESGVEALEDRGLIPLHEAVTLDFGNGVRHENYMKYMTYFMDTTRLMKQLRTEVKRLGIPVEMKEISSFDDVEEEVVFNCSGLGSRELNHDEQMIPVRGHLILLNEKAGTEHMDYMIYTKVMQNGKEEYIYLFPKAMAVSSSKKQGVHCNAVLGGTFIPNVDKLSAEQQQKLDAEEYQKMLDRSAMFFHGRKF